jgi:hypothetical protein
MMVRHREGMFSLFLLGSLSFSIGVGRAEKSTERMIKILRAVGEVARSNKAYE